MEILNEVCKRFPDIVSHIKIIHHEQNMGLASTRLTGIRAAQGEYIALCDSDDWVEPEMYEKMYSCAKRTCADVVYSNYYIEYRSKQGLSRLREVIDKDGYWTALLNGSLPSFSWMRLYKRDILVEHLSELYKKGVNMWEDALMNLMLMPYIQKVSFEPFAGYHYNQCNISALTNVWSAKSKENIKEVVDLVSSSLAHKREFLFPLSCFRLNALYSIASHSTLVELRNLQWVYWQNDAPCIWNHPTMNILNKIFLVLWEHHPVLASGLVKAKRFIRKRLLF